MSVRAVLFDLDGTLADTLEDIASAMNRALAASGLPPHPVDAYRRMVGEGAAVLAQRAVGARADLEVDVLAAYLGGYDQHLVERTRAYAGVEALLDGLGARRVPMAVLSNKPDPATRAVVEHLFGLARFAVVRGERAGSPRKPDPTAALELARALAATPGEIAFVGDTAIDMRTACAAGMLPVGVRWGFRTEQELRDAGARHMLAEPLDLLTLFEAGAPS